MIRLIYPDQLVFQPLIFPLREKLIEADLELVPATEEETVLTLQKGEAEMAFLSPLGYAMVHKGIKVVSDLMISSPKASRNILLFFRQNMKKIETIFYPENKKVNKFYRFIAELVLKEFFEIENRWEPAVQKGLSPELLDQYPLFFLDGDDAYEVFPDFENFIDLSEEWSIRTDLPLIHSILCVNDSFSDSAMLNILKRSREAGLQELKKISRQYSLKHRHPAEVYYTILVENFSYVADFDFQEALNQTLSYLFYYNQIEFFPEIEFFSE